MKRGGKEGEKGRNRDGGREGEKERERRGWTGWWRTAGRSSPFSLRQDTQVLSPIVFRCRLLHASLHRPATTPLRLHRQLVRKLSALVPGLFMPRWTTRQDAIRFARRLRAPQFRWVNGPRAPGETTGCWEKSQEGDGEFIVASWIPLLPIRFREAGSRMRKEATGCLSVQRVSKRGIFRGNGSTKRAELCLLNFYFTRKKTMGATDPCPDQFPTIFKIQLAIAIDEKSPGSRIISRAREKFLEARNLESRSEEMEMVNRTRGL